MWPRNKKPDEVDELHQWVLEQQREAFMAQQRAQQAIPMSQLNAYMDMMKRLANPPLVLGGAQAAPVAPLPKALLAGPIVAWRLWRAKPDGSLWSANQNRCCWPSGEPLVADARPASRNGHGVYAMKKRETVAMGEYRPEGDERIVRGSVALWGLVIEHKDGYRAEFAYPVTIECGTRPMPGFPRVAGFVSLADKIRERYGCEVIG